LSLLSVTIAAENLLVRLWFKRQLGDSRAAAGAGPIALMHLALETAAASLSALRTAFLMTFAAINRPIRGRLKRQLGDLRTAAGAGPIALEHLPLEAALRSLVTKGHIFLTSFLPNLGP